MNQEIIDKIVMTFYKLTQGYLPEEDVLNKTENIIKHLIDNRYSEGEIINILLDINKIKIEPIDLPEYLWEESILNKNTFYYHGELHLTSKAPKWDPITMKVIAEPYYLEMKIRYTIKDLLNYFYNKLLIPFELRDDKKDIGSFNHLLNKYKKMEVESIDFVLTLIDFSAKEENKITNVLDLSKKEAEVFEHYKAIIPMAEYDKVNKIIWR